MEGAGYRGVVEVRDFCTYFGQISPPPNNGKAWSALYGLHNDPTSGPNPFYLPSDGLDRACPASFPGDM